MPGRLDVSLHFTSPSRQFYLSLIALLVQEMKRLGRITSIPLDEHHQILAVLNETVGGAAGSSNSEQLLPRIYRKWKDALPNLEHAPLFRVLGRSKEYEDAVGKTYSFTDEEKDSWANLFEYMGSREHVRLRFSVDRLGATLEDVAIVYGDKPKLSDGDAWTEFIGTLKRRLQGRDESRDAQRDGQNRADLVAPTHKGPLLNRAQWTVLGCLAVMIVIGAPSHRHLGNCFCSWSCRDAHNHRLGGSSASLGKGLLGTHRTELMNRRPSRTISQGSYLPPFRNFPRNNRQMLTLNKSSVNYLFVTYSQM